jgi:hypothetical protein
MYIIYTPTQKKKERETTGGIAWGCSSARRAEVQTLEPATETHSSCSHSKTRITIVRTSLADFDCAGMSRMGNTPRSTRASEITISDHDSCTASMEHSSTTPATCSRSFSISTNRSLLSKGSVPHACSSANFSSHCSRSVSRMKRVNWHPHRTQSKSRECR